MLGATANVDVVVSNLHADDIDCAVVVGGMGSPEYLWEDHNLHTLLKNLNSQGKVIGAICLSGAVLARAGVLNGKQATVYPMPESLKALKDGHANYVEQPVVQDGHIITADGPPARLRIRRNNYQGAGYRLRFSLRRFITAKHRGAPDGSLVSLTYLKETSR